MPDTIFVFGGSFNPPHIGHQAVCLWLLSAYAPKQVWVVPTYRHAFAKRLISFDHRFRMAELAMEVFREQVKVIDVERQLAQAGGNPEHTLEVLTALQRQHPTVSFRLVIGADILTETDRWYRWGEICKIAPPIVIGRVGYTGGDEFSPPDVSSAWIRKKLATGGRVSLVSRAVMQYIEQHGLYNTSDTNDAQ